MNRRGEVDGCMLVLGAFLALVIVAALLVPWLRERGYPECRRTYSVAHCLEAAVLDVSPDSLNVEGGTT